MSCGISRAEFPEEQVACYVVTASPIYKETARFCKMLFRLPNARILATFDNEGTLQHSFENFKDMAAQEEVRHTLFTDYVAWQKPGNTCFVISNRTK